jgi:PIN domain nuclease of toxin-antitoxin system
VKYLLDTHALLWWFNEPERLSSAAHAAILNGEEVVVSAVSAMEIAIKYRKGRLPYPSSLAVRFAATVATEDFVTLAINVDHAQRAGAYPAAHADPWDRLLAAQAEVGGLQLISCDKQIAALGVTTLW